MALPRLDKIFAVRTSAGRTSLRNIAIERSTESGVKPWPVRKTTSISLINCSINLTLVWGPSKVISFPRTKITTSGNACSITLINSSRVPTTETIGVDVGTTTTECTGAAEIVIGLILSD